MDVEKDKPPPENDDDNKITDEKPGTDPDLPKESEHNSLSSPKPPPEADLNVDQKEEKDGDLGSENDDKKDADPNSDIGDEKEVEEESGEAAQVEAPPSPFDLRKVSVEIDEYIAALSSQDNEESAPPVSVPKLVERFGYMVETKTADYDSGDGPVRWNQLSEDDSSTFLEAISRVSTLLKALSRSSTDPGHSSSINLIGSVLQRAMSYIEEEFKSLLEDYKIQDPNSNDEIEEAAQEKEEKEEEEEEEEEEEKEKEESMEKEENYTAKYSDEILSGLIQLSQTMIIGGHELECFHAFFVARRKALEATLQKLEFEKHSIDDVVRMQWEPLEKEIVAWIRTLKLCSTHFTSEHKLCNSIFPDHPSISETIFLNLTQGVIIQLLNFAGAVAIMKHSSEKLFKLLDAYEALRDNLPVLDDIFPEKWINEVKAEASIIKSQLGGSIISIFTDLESSIKLDMAKTAVPGGAVHPLTRYTMNYLKLAGVYKDTLEQVYREHQKIERADSGAGSNFNHNASAEVVRHSSFQSQMIKLMDTLDQNLEGKSKLYKDVSLCSIFMMNNGRYIVQRVRGSDEMNSLMGDTWCRKKSSDLRQYHKVYQRETWGKLLSSLHPEGLTSHGKVMKPVLKERFKSFNAMFDEIHRTQSTWVVCDEQLQSELRVSISNMVIPAYRSFLARYAQVFTPGRQTEKYVKYQGEDIETYIDELFDGKK